MSKFKFGDKVWHKEYGLCVITGSSPLNAHSIAHNHYARAQLPWFIDEDDLTPVTDWVKFDITDIETYPPANDSRLIRFSDGTCGTVYVTDNNEDNPLGCGVDKKWSFYSEAGFANLENVTHHHPLPAPPTEVER